MPYWEEAAAYCPGNGGQVAWKLLNRLVICIWGDNRSFMSFDHSGASATCLSIRFIGNGKLVEAEAKYFMNDETAARAGTGRYTGMPRSGRNPEYTCDKSGESSLE